MRYSCRIEMAKIMTDQGGPSQIGRHLGIATQAVSLWVSKGKIPVARVPAMVRMAKDKGLNFGPETFCPGLDWPALQ